MDVFSQCWIVIAKKQEEDTTLRIITETNISRCLNFCFYIDNMLRNLPGKLHLAAFLCFLSTIKNEMTFCFGGDFIWWSTQLIYNRFFACWSQFHAQDIATCFLAPSFCTLEHLHITHPCTQFHHTITNQIRFSGPKWRTLTVAFYMWNSFQ